MSKEGSDLYKKAEKSLKKYERFGNEKNLVKAIDFFQKSADSYQKANEWSNAGESYLKASDCLQEHNQLNDASIAATNAGNMFLKTSETSQKAFDSFSTAARFLREDSKPINAAKLLCDTGKLFFDQKDIENSIKSYKAAAQIYDDENKPIQAANQITIIGDIYSTQNNYLEASNSYKEVARRRFSDTLTKVSAIEFCTKSVISRMAADDVVGAESFLRDFNYDFPAFEKSKECTVLRLLIRAINKGDPDEFSKIVKEYDEYRMLDEWTANALNVVQKLVEKGEEEEIC